MYSFVKLTMGYVEYLEALYAGSGMEETSYEEQQQFVFRDGFGEANNMQLQLSNLGVQADTIIGNCRPMQEAWAKERGLSLPLEDIVLEQLRELQPTVLFIHNCFTHSDIFILQAKNVAPSIKLVIGWCGIGFNNEWVTKWRQFDAILSCNPAQVHDFEKAGIPTGLLNHGFELGALDRLEQCDGNESFDVLFSGSLIASNSYHQGRINWLLELVRHGVPVRILSKPLPNTDKFPQELLPLIEPPRYGVRMLSALSRAKIVLNYHLDANRGYAGNSRLFETTGVGTCLLTDDKKNIDTLFVPDSEIVTYDGVEQCLEKIAFLLENDAERKRIATSGQQRTLGQYTYAHRARALHDYICEQLA